MLIKIIIYIIKFWTHRFSFTYCSLEKLCSVRCAHLSTVNSAACFLRAYFKEKFVFARILSYLCAGFENSMPDAAYNI